MAEALQVQRDDRGVARVTIDRPEVRNAFDDALIAELARAFQELSEDDAVRVVVLTGAGRIFSAGADLNWMRGMVDYSYEENLQDSRELEAMLRAVQTCRHPVLARVNGHALGGGSGLVAACDIAVAQRGSLFGFTEVRLGLAPAVISPYVLPKIGVSNARHLFLTGERFDADVAARIGLVHRVVGTEELDGAVEQVLQDLLASGPHAQAAMKRLLAALESVHGLEDAAAETAPTIAELRVSEEGQEGMTAFFEKREPAWREH